MRIGIIASSGGSVFSELARISNFTGKKHQYFVVTDRRCGIESVCLKQKITFKRIQESSNRVFSIKSKEFFDENGGVDILLLFFLRLITKELYGNLPVFNIHPSLLPAFPGFGAIKEAKKSGVKYLGATLHFVSGGIDNGEIIAQTSAPISNFWSEKKLMRISFFQKVYLGLLLIDLFEKKYIKISKKPIRAKINNNLGLSNLCNPEIQNRRYLKALTDLKKRENLIFL